MSRPGSAVAIVGMGCRFAGARDLHEYWQMCLEGRDGFGPVPADRWDHEAFYSANPRDKDKSTAPRGGFIDDIRSFPAVALGVPPRRVEVMDPQQRMTLEVCLEAVGDAGRRPEDLPRRTGVYVGVTAVEYRTLLSSRILAQSMASGALGAPPDDPEALARAVQRLVPPRPFTAPGLLANMTAATVAQELRLHGPAFTSDAACASALVAIGDAVLALRAGQIDAALAGGVYLCVTPEHHVAFSRIGAMSRSGECLPFDARADGFVQGDGCGVVLLRRLEDARRDGDRIVAVIEGIALNNDGGGEGPMAPVKDGQVECIQLAWDDAGRSAESLGYVETHGTGTQVGDRIELEGLIEGLSGVKNAALGSSKANVGHTMSAAGVAGVIRAALAVHHRTIPPMAGFESAKPDLPLGTTGFRIPTSAEPWIADERVAAVSSFGFGGTNVHAVLRSASPEVAPPEQAELVLMSAPDLGSLQDLAERTAAAIERDPTATVAGVARAWAIRDRQPARLAVVASSREELIAGLRAPTLIGTCEGRPRVAFMYPGQGAQRTGMLAGARRRFPVVAETLREVDAALDDVDLQELLYPEVDDEAAAARLTDTQHCQPALLAAGIALTRLLEQVGVRPDVALGHSVGEFTAAVAAGVLSPADGARWTRARGRAMAALAGDPGAMVALSCDATDAEALVVDGAVVANVNHPRQVVVSGATRAVAEVSRRAEAAGIRAVPLPVSHGFHSPVFGALDLRDDVARLDLRDPVVPLVSCIQDGPYRDAADARAVFEAHATSPVQFTRTLERAEADVFLQVGAGGPLVSFARGTLKGRGKRFVPLASTDDHDGGASLLRGLGQLWIAGVDLDVRSITAPAPVASVPPRVLPREVYWAIKDTGAAPTLARGAAREAAQATAAVEAATEPRDDTRSRVLGAIARASAYPMASLRDEMSLTADLGFDSMMLAELTAELTRAVPGLDGIPQDLLLKEPTIGALVAYAEAPAAAAASDDDAPLKRYAPHWRDAPPRPGPAREGEALIFTWEPTAPLSAVLSGEAAAPDPAAALLEQVRATGRRDVIVVCRHDDPFAEALAGAVRALAAEWPEAVCKCIRTDGPVDAALAEQERRDVNRTPDVRWIEGRRQALGTRALEAAPPLWSPEGEVVLVTGGSRGIGAQLADRLEAAGATVLRLGRAQADVLDLDGLRAWLADQPPVTALVHAAGLLADGPVEAVDEALGRLARDVKGRGLLNAIRALGPSLKVVLGLGSWAGRFGNRHQVHYASGNALMSGLIAALPPRIRGVACELGPWTDSDMARSIPEPVRASMRASGVDFVGPEAGLDALMEDLRGGEGAVIRGRRVPPVLTRAEVAEMLSVETHPYLADHAVDGRPVLPLAGAAALLADAAAVQAPFELTDLTLYAPVAVTSSVDVRCVVQRDRAELRAGETTAYKAGVRPLEEPPPSEATWRTGGAAPELSLATFYAEHTFHGPLLQGIESIDAVGPGVVQGRVRVGRRSDWVPGDERPWRVDPLALDSAMQLAAYVAWTRFGRAGTPVSVGRLVQRAPLEAGSVRAQVLFEAGDGDRFTARIELWSDDGALLMWAENVVAQLLLAGGASGHPQTPPPAAASEGTRPDREDEPGSAEATDWTQWTDPTRWPEVVELEARQRQVAALGFKNPYFDVHEGTARDTTRIEGREVINYSSYNYLGLSGDPRIQEAVTEAMARYGTSVSASRVACGERPFHGALERGLAEAQGAEDAIVFPSGHATNVTVIGHLFGPKDLVLHDELIHDSCLQGIKLSGAARRGFRHDDPEHLESQLKDLRRHYEKVLILIEGVYSMDGDVARLPEYIRLKHRHGCLLMVDEAHSFGTIGRRGHGIGEHHGIDGAGVDLWMGTLSKSLASMGGWIAGRRALMNYLRYTTPGFVFAAGMAPTLGQAALSALTLMREEPWRVERLQHNSRLFARALASRGVNIGDARGDSPVVPVITGDSARALHLSEHLLAAGINAKPIIFPAVAENAARLRFFLTALHTESQLHHTAETIATAL